MAELIPGIDLLSDAFRSNGRSVLAALRWITEELARARYLITVRELLQKNYFLKQEPQWSYPKLILRFALEREVWVRILTWSLCFKCGMVGL